MKFSVKFNFISRLCAFVFCTAILALPIVAQGKLPALKFDEFDISAENQFFWSYEEEISFAQRIERFVTQLKKERGVKVYIIYYQGRISDSGNGDKIDNKADRIKFQIQYRTQIKPEDIFVIDGGYREADMFEFWIAPKNAAPPALTPTLAKSETFVCPTVTIYDDTSMGNTETIIFRASEDRLKGIKNYSLTWKTSAGEIIDGQGSDFIKVKLDDSAVRRVTAFLEVGGLPYPCPKVFSKIGEIKGKVFQVDSAERYNYSDLSARMDYFMFMLNNYPAAKGYIIIYAGRGYGSAGMERAIKSVKNIFTFRKYDTSRVTIIRGGYREYNTVDSWILLDDAEPPKPTPTVNGKFINGNTAKRKSRPKSKP